MNRALRTSLALAAILAAAALFAPLAARVLPFSFERILTRTVTILFLAWVFLVELRHDRNDLAKLVGSGDARLRAKDFAAGFLAGAVGLALFSLIAVACGAKVWEPRLEGKFLPLSFSKYLAGALAVGFVEEFFFRGWLFGVAFARLPLRSRIVLSSSIYAATHFLRTRDMALGAAPGILDSLRVYAGILHRFIHPDWRFVLGMIGLFLFGWLLAKLFTASGSLFLSIGLHAGAVFWIRSDGVWLQINPAVPEWLFGDKNYYAGILTWAFMAVLALGIWKAYLPFRKPS